MCWLPVCKCSLTLGCMTRQHLRQRLTLQPLVPAGTAALCAAMSLVWILSHLLPSAAALRWLEPRLGRRPSSRGFSGWLRQQTAALLAGLAHESAAHLALNLLTMVVAAGAAERQLSSALCRASGSGSGGLLCSRAAAGVAFAAAFLASCAVGRAAAAMHTMQGADPGTLAVLLALLATEGWQQAAALATAGGGGIPAASRLAGLALATLPWPLLQRAASMLQPLLLWQRGPAAAPPAVLLAAARVAAQQLLLRPQPAGLLREPGRQPGVAATRRQHVGASRLLRGAFAMLAEAALLPLLPLIRPIARWASRATPACLLACAAGGLGVAQLALVLSARATLGLLQRSRAAAAAHLAITLLSALLLLVSTRVRPRQVPC